LKALRAGYFHEFIPTLNKTRKDKRCSFSLFRVSPVFQIFIHAIFVLNNCINIEGRKWIGIFGNGGRGCPMLGTGCPAGLVNQKISI
jgi:hypothetical protein